MERVTNATTTQQMLSAMVSLVIVTESVLQVLVTKEYVPHVMAKYQVNIAIYNHVLMMETVGQVHAITECALCVMMEFQDKSVMANHAP